MPELEGRWYTTSGINPDIGRTLNADGSVLVPGQQTFNQCGVAKWSCVTAPATASTAPPWRSSTACRSRATASASGTSMAGPHSAAALALIMQRFPYMTNEQALYTMFTTGRQNTTINNAAGTAVPNPTRGQIVQVPDARNGWHTPNLREAFKGPGQLLGPTDIDTQGYSDVWSNDISDVAIQARQAEDASEAAAWQATKVAKGWTNGLPPEAEPDRRVGLRHRHAPRGGTRRAGLHGQPDQGRRRHAVPDRRQHAGTARARSAPASSRSIGSHASSIDVTGGTLGGSGTVGGAIDVAGGVLAPGLAPAEAARITAVPVTPGNVLHAGGDVRIAGTGRLAVTVRSDTDYSQAPRRRGPRARRAAGPGRAGSADARARR